MPRNDAKVKLLKEASETLTYLADQADEDCPSEYRTDHLRDALADARGLAKKIDKAIGKT